MILQLLKDTLLELRKTHPNANMYVTGGIVRSMIWNTFDESDVSNDWDIEVFGVVPTEFDEFISAKFPSKKIWSNIAYIIQSDLDSGHKIQWGFPRRDKSIGPHHQDFNISYDEKMSIREAQLRRDFTMNGVYFCVDTHEFIDNFNGIEHAEGKLIVPISKQAISDDPVRVLRGVRFVFQHDLILNNDFISVASQTAGMSLRLDKSRTWLEFLKMFTSPHIKAGLKAMDDIRMLNHISPLYYLKSVTYLHRGITKSLWESLLDLMDAFVPQVLDTDTLTEHEKFATVIACLFSDVGKAYVTSRVLSGGTVFPQHQLSSVSAYDSDFAPLIGSPASVNSQVVKLIYESEFLSGEVNPVTVRHLKDRTKNLKPEMLEYVLLFSSYMNLTGQITRSYYKRLVASVDIKPLLNGRDLIEIGMEPGASLGYVLKSIYTDQLDGVVSTKEEALKKAKRYANIR